MTINETKNVGDEFIEETEDMAKEQENPNAGLYDLVLPPGVPQKVIIEAMEKFNLEVATRKCALKTIDTENDNLLVLRGELDEVNNAHDYIFQKMSEKFNYKRQR